MEGLVRDVPGAAHLGALVVDQPQTSGVVLPDAAADEGSQPEVPAESEVDAQLEVHPLEPASAPGDGAPGAADAEVEPLVPHADAQPGIHQAIRREVPEHLEAEAHVARRA